MERIKKIMYTNTKIINIQVKLGERLKQARINANLTQSQLGDIIGKSRTAVERAEKGKCNLNTFIRILVALDADDQLDLFLPESPLSPVLLAKAQGKQRKRASNNKLNTDKTKTRQSHEDNLEW